MSNRLQRENGPNGAREPSQRRRHTHPALKHAAYSGMSLLPGEDPAEFETLHNELVAEYAPTGQHEHEIVETMARLMWRKRCLWSYGLAEFARKRYSAIKLEQEKAGETRSHEIWTKKREHREKVDNALEQYRAEKDAKGEPLSREEMQQIKTQYADPDVAAEEGYRELWGKLMQHPKFRERTAQREVEEKQIRREMGDAPFELARISHVTTTGYLMHELSIIDRIDAMIDRCLKRLLLVRGVKSISPSLSKPTPKQIPSS
ncbi:MAG TPA: hypothetical protein VK653_02565 [Xanthobacteraceae bacterium]|nr:hypothetical protein [Xanthobacteraceae bacterium]